MTDQRKAVFLDEMGVGPQWRLRDRPAPAAHADAMTDAAYADSVPVEAPPAAPAPAPAAVAAPAAARAAAPVQAAAPAPAPAAVVPPAAAHVAAPVQAAAPAPTVAPMPAIAPAQAAVPAASPARRAPEPPAEDMSWFDNAPTPAYQPQRKKVPAPEQSSAAAPARKLPPAPAAQPQTDDVPDFGDLPMEAPPDWFDEEAAASAPRTGAVSDAQIAAMDWPGLQAAVQSCTRCTLCQTRQHAIPGRGDEQAGWLVLDTMPSAADDAEGYLFAGEPGYLLDNMLKAVQQSTARGAYLTSLVKCHADRAPTADELQACRPYLQRELHLTGAKVVLALGHRAAKGLLGSAARGRIMLHEDKPVVATYHPADLLKKPEDKAGAWQDLCLAKAAHGGRR